MRGGRGNLSFPLLMNLLALRLILIAIAAVFLAYQVVATITYRRGKTWPSAPGVVKRSRMVGGGRRNAGVPDVRYEFEVDGKKRTSGIIYAGGLVAQRGGARPGEVHPVVEDYPEGKEVTVHYHPKVKFWSFVEVDRGAYVRSSLTVGLVIAGLALVFYLTL